MYRVDKQAHHHRRARRWSIALFSLLMAIGVVYGIMHIRINPKQNIHNPAPVSTNYKAQESRKVIIDKPLFKMDLPYGWTELAVDSGQTGPIYSFRGPYKDARMLDMYIDNVPVNMAFNRAIAVSQQGQGLTYDVVSENCTTFTNSTKTAVPRAGSVIARWQGIDFACDTANYSRAVVGSVSTAGMNQIAITTKAGAHHQLFIAYTDNNINPDYGILYAILGSFEVK